VILNSFLSVVPGVLVGLVVYSGGGSYVADPASSQPHKTRSHPPILLLYMSNHWFKEQPDYGPLARPKHVVVFYILLYITL
jgi:hypothetical protein